MQALPFWNQEISLRKPLSFIEVNENSPISQHLRKKRLELKLKQGDVSKILDVSEATISLWETDRAVPQIQNMPKIIKWLGYNPYSFKTENLGERIKEYRLLHGLSHRKMGKLLQVDGATISTWETNKFIPNKGNIAGITALLKGKKGGQTEIL